MTNFLIAVITTTYEKVKKYQKIISFRHKAELNEECYMLMGVFRKLPEYKIITLSASKETTKQTDNEVVEVVESLKKFMTKETKEIKTSHKELNDNIMVVRDNQDKLVT